jgi:nucleoside-diphosphate-sugar epimerase
VLPSSVPFHRGQPPGRRPAGPTGAGDRCVFHQAAQAGVRASWEEFAEYTSLNILGTQQLLEAAKPRALQVRLCLILLGLR